jgi:hypothetical protein
VTPAATTSTRRRFLLAAAGAASSLALPAAGRAAPASTAPATATFRSRPDLTPPLLTVDSSAPNAAPGYVFSAPFVGQAHGTALISDGHGNPVWIYQSPKLVMNFRPQTLAGKPVLTWWEGSVRDGLFEGECVIADASYRVVSRLSGGTGFRPEVHEFLLTSRGTALVSINNLVPADLTAYGGPADATIVEGVVRELDVASGRVLFDWHSLEHVDPAESALPAGAIWDYFHLNSIDVDVDGNLVISARYPSTIYKLDRTTGAVLWRLGGTRSDFALADGARFAFQHDARCLPNGRLSLFDDGSDGSPNPPEQVSRALELALDLDAMTATLVAELPNPRGLLTTAMGNAQRLAGGGCFVGWGTVPELTEFGPNGAVLYDASLPAGYASYRAFRAPWAGRPATSPSLAVSRAGTALDVSASWNGATALSHWAVNGGSSRDRLATLRTVPRAGFETTVRLARQPAYVQVVALDAAGAALGASAIVPT